MPRVVASPSIVDGSHHNPPAVDFGVAVEDNESWIVDTEAEAEADAEAAAADTPEATEAREDFLDYLMGLHNNRQRVLVQISPYLQNAFFLNQPSTYPIYHPGRHHGFLHAIIAARDLAFLELFLNTRRIDINWDCKLRLTPLAHAMALRWDAGVKCILDMSASLDPNKAFGQQNPPLHYAIFYHQKEYVTWLLQHPSIDINKQGPFGCPLECTIVAGDLTIFEAIWTNPNTKRDVRTYQGNYTPFLLAVFYDRVEMARRIYQDTNGACLHERNAAGRTALDIAFEREGKADNVLNWLLTLKAQSANQEVYTYSVTLAWQAGKSLLNRVLGYTLFHKSLHLLKSFLGRTDVTPEMVNPEVNTLPPEAQDVWRIWQRQDLIVWSASTTSTTECPAKRSNTDSDASNATLPVKRSRLS